MRIIGGRLGGRRIQVPGNLPVRPTTDLSKEALFNILVNRFDFESLTVLDLFSGTGSLSLEFASRGAASVTSVDTSYHCVRFLKETAQTLKFEAIRTLKADVFRFVTQEKKAFDIIFADPPFDHPKLRALPGLITGRSLLRDEESLFIMEHPSSMQFDHFPGFSDRRQYGYSSFSFFRRTQAIH
jgi:16S rRNA (guanine(966)-N(2))-methyltransferase RsmD